MIESMPKDLAIVGGISTSTLEGKLSGDGGAWKKGLQPFSTENDPTVKLDA